jgi:glycosyltransferase involved in cell wall biosynthesis
VARKLGIPVVYEIRAFWEDAAVDHGTTNEGSLRYRATRKLETRAIQQVDHVFTICEGLRADIVGRGVAAEKVTVIPNAVDIASFKLASPPDPELQKQWGLTGKTVIGFIGSFYAYEGLDLLLNALPAIIEQSPTPAYYSSAAAHKKPTCASKPNNLDSRITSSSLAESRIAM